MLECHSMSVVISGWKVLVDIVSLWEEMNLIWLIWYVIYCRLFLVKLGGVDQEIFGIKF